MVNKIHPATQAAVDAGECDPEMVQFMAELETAIQDAKAGKFTAIYRSGQIGTHERDKCLAAHSDFTLSLLHGQTLGRFQYES